MQNPWNYLFIFLSLYMHMHVILIRTVEIVHKTDSPVYISLLGLHIFKQHLWLTDEWERTGRKKNFGLRSLSFFFLSLFSMLMTGQCVDITCYRKWRSSFANTIALFLYSEQIQVRTENGASWLAVPGFVHWRCSMLTLGHVACSPLEL